MSTSVEVLELPWCDFCAQQGADVVAKYDAKTLLGPWANLCGLHFRRYGIGLGTGLGQRLVVRERK